MIPEPPSPSGLVDDHWPEIDELGLGMVGAKLLSAGAAALTAEAKAMADGQAYSSAAPLGFEAQTSAAFRVGGMATQLAAWLAKGGAEATESGASVLSTKVFITVAVEVAEALIAAMKAEIALLQASPLPPQFREPLIQQLQQEIRQVTDAAKKDIQALYNGIYTPTTPTPPGLQPLQHNGPPASPMDNETGAGGQGPTAGDGGRQWTQSPGGALQVKPTDWGAKPEAGPPPPADGPQPLSTGPPGQTPWGLKPPVDPPPTPTAPVGSPVQPPMTTPMTPISSLTSVPKMPSLPSGGMPSLPSGGLPSLPGTSGLTGGGLPGGPQGLAAPQQFLTSAAQGFASQTPPLTNAAASAPFRPPAESMLQAAPAAAAPPAPPVGQPVVATAQSGAAVPAPPSGAVPLAAPPPAGVPNPPSPSPPPPGGPGLLGQPASGSAGYAPPASPPPSVMNLGAGNAVLRAVKMGSHTTGVGLSGTPEFAAALALVAALNDPTFGVVCEWACAVFQREGGEPRFVVASREGLSWIPSGLYMPDGVVVATLDDNIDWSTRKMWRGLKPPARVLFNYARAIGEDPTLVVARHYLGLDGLFSKRTVVVADDGVVADQNPLRDPAGHHRLEVASPDHWWPRVQNVPDDEIAHWIRTVAETAADAHDQAFGPDPLRATAVEHIGRAGSNEIRDAVAERMHYVRGEIMTAPIAAPEPLVDGWNDGLVGGEMLLRGYETLWLALHDPTREALADMIYAAIAAGVT
jgi:hypothetical protein